MLTDEQKELRKKGIGGSDAAAVLGVNPWKTPFDLWAEKALDDYESQNGNEAMWIGGHIESTIDRLYQERTGNFTYIPEMTFFHKDHSFLLGNLDRIVNSNKKGLEIKNVGPYQASKWGDDGTQDIPEYVAAQIAHYRLVTGFKKWDVAALINGNNLRIYPDIEPSDSLIKMILGKEIEFWDRVKRKDPPLPTAKDLDVLKQLWPKDRGTEKIADTDLLGMVEIFKEYKQRLKKEKKKAGFVEAKIKHFMADNSILVGPQGQTLATWKKSKDSEVVDWRGAFYELAKSEFSDDPSVIELLIENHRSIEPGSRRFLVK